MSNEIPAMVVGIRQRWVGFRPVSLQLLPVFGELAKILPVILDSDQFIGIWIAGFRRPDPKIQGPSTADLGYQRF